MNRKLLAFLRRGQFPLIIALGTAPIMVLLFAYTAQDLLRWSWVFPAAYAALALPALVIKGSRRFPYGVTAAAALILLTVLLVPAGNRLSALVAAAFYGVVLLWSLRIAGWSAEQEITQFWAFFGIIMHLLVQGFRNDPNLKCPDAYAIACHWLLGAFLLFVILVMLSMNRGSLWTAGGDRQRASASMRRKNILMTLCFFVLALLISLVPAIAQGIKTLALWVVLLVQRLIQLFPDSDQEITGSSSVDTTEDLSLSTDEYQTSRFMEVLQDVMQVFCLVVVAVVLILMLWWIGKKLFSLLRRLWTSLGRYAANVAEDYEDEITDTRDTDSPERLRRRAGTRRIRAADRRAMTPVERIRWRYRCMVAEHPEWTADTTARENLPPELAPLYERARYSDHPVTEEEASHFDTQTQKRPGR